MKPSVAIVILNWNQWAVTRQCLESLQNLSYPNFRVFIADNASDDPPPPEITTIIPNITIIRNPENWGFGKGNNPAIRAALENGAEMVWLLNNDTTVLPDTLTRLVDKMGESERIGAVGAEIYDMTGTNLLVRGGDMVNLERFYTAHLPVGDMRTPDYITGASILLRAAALHEIGLFDENFFMYWEDVDLSLRLRNAGWELAVADGAIVCHAEGSSAPSDLRYCHAVRSVFYFAQKYSRHRWRAKAWLIYNWFIMKAIRREFGWLRLYFRTWWKNRKKW